MLTQCDRCEAVFRVHSAQLRQAQGFVRCGACQQVFHAVDRLLEESPAETEAADHAAPQQPPDLGSAATSAAPTSVATASEQPATANARAPVPATQEPVSVADQEELPPLRRDTAAEDEYRDATEAPGATADESIEPEEDEPEVLQQDLAALRGQPVTRADGRRLWATLALLLMLALAAQVTWFLREPLLARFPTWREPVERWCAALGCQLGVNGPAPNIELLARDVRDHPRFASALLANLTMISRAGTVQRYPRIELRLFDAMGQMLGKRRFAPEEYLDPSIDVAAGMQPSRPVFVVLELAGPYTSAVGFEFDFP